MTLSDVDSHFSGDPSESLCLSCGLCCDGTLFSNVQVGSDDDLSSLNASGIKVVEKGDSKQFDQPCAAHKMGVCIVYKSRPQKCRVYKCKLLKKIEHQIVSYRDAREIVVKAVELRDAVRSMIVNAAEIKGASIEAIRTSVSSWLRDPSPSTSNHLSPELCLKFTAMQYFLDRHFRKLPVIRTSPTSPAVK